MQTKKINIIEEKKLKLTSARKELLAIFSLEKRPLSFEDIKKQNQHG